VWAACRLHQRKVGGGGGLRNLEAEGRGAGGVRRSATMDEGPVVPENDLLSGGERLPVYQK